MSKVYILSSYKYHINDCKISVEEKRASNWSSEELNSGKLAFTAFNVEQIQTWKQVVRKMFLGNKYDLWEDIKEKILFKKKNLDGASSFMIL